MKLEQLKKIYTEKVAQYINDGWTIDPCLSCNDATASVVFARDGIIRVVYMNIKNDFEYAYSKSVVVGFATINQEHFWSDVSFYLSDCSERTETKVVEIKEHSGWFVTPEDRQAQLEKICHRYSVKRRVGMFRVFLGKNENPSPEACRKALKLVRKVPGYGNTALKNIARIWFECCTEMVNPNWSCKPTLCVQILGRGSKARIPMPAYK